MPEKVKELPLDQIEDNIIGRIDKDKLESISESIRAMGLIQPIRVARHSDHFILVAGKLRLHAYKSMGRTHIPCIISEKAHPDTRIHENLKRRHLSWDEEAILIKELHERNQQEHGVSNKGRAKKSGWTVRDTANELGKALGAVSQSINLAKAVENDPSLRKIKDKSTAIKIVKMRRDQLEQEEESLAPIEIEAEDEIFCGDSSEILKKIEADCVHAVITDPPWLRFGGDKKLERDSNTLPVFREVYRVMNRKSFLYMFVSLNDFWFYLHRLPKLGFNVQQAPLIWHKTKFLSRRSTGSFYGRDYEFILVATKGKPILYEKTYPNSVISQNIVHASKIRHPHEKPMDIIRLILSHCTVSGNLVLDPFAGSFVVPKTCIDMKRSFIAIERDPEFFKQGKERLGL